MLYYEVSMLYKQISVCHSKQIHILFILANTVHLEWNEKSFVGGARSSSKANKQHMGYLCYYKSKTSVDCRSMGIYVYFGTDGQKQQLLLKPR